jgi:integrase
MAKLTAKFVENLKPRDKRVEIPDSGCTGLYLISQSSGVRSFAVRYRYGGRSVKLTLGKWPAMTLAAARKAAGDAQLALEQGNNPAKAKADSKIKADAAKADTLTAICEKYLAREGKKLRTLDQRTSILRRLIYPVLGGKPIGSIKRSDIVAMLDRIEDRNGPRAADVTLAVLRKVMNWYATRADDFVPPFVRGMARQNAKDHRRERILSDDEIRAVWQAAAPDQPFGALVRFLLLTSARRNEAAGMKRDEVDADGIWALPPSRSKTKAEVVRPLSKTALALIEGLPQIDGCDFVFTSTARTPIRQFSGPKAKLDAASGTSGWTIHDLRRSARSLLSRAGVNSDVAEKCLGHSRGDIIERYDRHPFLPEMRVAFEKLATTIEHIVNPPEGAVIPMRRR